MYTIYFRLACVIVGATLVLLFAGCAKQATKSGQVDGLASGAVAGTLTINGAATSLRYAYARRHEGRPLDVKRLGLHEDQELPDGIVYVLITNRPVSEQQIARIIDDKYDGAKNLNGVLLAFDPNGSHHWESQFLTDTQLISIYGMTSTGGPPLKIENGRIIGMLALQNQDAVYQRAFLVYFNAPLAPAGVAWTSDIGNIGAPPCGSMQAFADFTRTLPGPWAIETWAGSNGNSYTGTLAVDERISSNQFHGMFHFVIGDDKPDIDEQVTLTCTDAGISVHGAVIPETRWSPDTLELELKGKRMVGDGMDYMGQKQHIVLKKAH